MKLWGFAVFLAFGIGVRFSRGCLRGLIGLLPAWTSKTAQEHGIRVFAVYESGCADLLMASFDFDATVPVGLRGSWGELICGYV